MSTRIQRLQGWFATVGTLPTDSEDLRTQKTALVMTACLMTVAAALWPFAYLTEHRYLTASIPATYAVVSILSLVLFAWTKQFAVFRFLQILLIVVLPFGVAVSLGGYAQASGVMMWAFLPVVGATVFHPQFATAWFIAWESALVLGSVLDGYIQRLAAPLPLGLTDAFWIGNVGGVTLVVFLVVRYSFRRNQSMLHEVRAQRHATEAALAKVGEQAEQLKELDRAKTLFFANVSHELRTPLTLLLGPLQSTLQSGQLPEDAHRRLSLASRNGRRLLRQINLLLDFTKAESGNMELELKPENPAKLCASLVDEARPSAASRNIELKFHDPGHIPFVELDRDRLDQALLNLLGNAIKFTPEGGRIDVAVRVEGPEVLISVTDTGIGIPEAEIPRLFQSFQQARRSSASTGAAMYRQEHQGTGLGLAMVRQIVELHKGRVGVTSQPDQGSTFTIALPIVYTHREKRPTEPGTMPPPAPRPIAQGPRAELADVELQDDDATVVTADAPHLGEAPGDDVRRRILIIDDHADVRVYLRDLLGSTYRLLEASDGQQGIDLALRELPDLIISDVMMPKKSGFEVLDELKGNARTRGIPILLLTARSGVEGTVEGLRRGADDYLAKPFDPKELSARVFSLLRLTQMERELAKVYAIQKEELDAARVIQECLLPASAPEVPGLDVAGKIITASELGGDFYDFVPLAKAQGVPKKLGVAIGDVTGHGASSALVTAIAKAGLDTQGSDRAVPAEVLRHLGRVVFDSCRGHRLMTFFYGVVDVERAQLSYCNAGHTFPCVVNSQTGKFYPLTHAGSGLGAPLGVERQAEYTAHTAPLTPGDVLILFSDGLLEAESKSGQAYGMRRLRQVLEKHRHLPAQQMVDRLLENVMTYSERQTPEDDITAVIVRLDGAHARA